ncbi:MAG: hypothetical protein FWF24_04555 [Alphaproteobacteria bacterium]|nr:hypothetical protein [Alphaproteobacteria bacterium]
MTGKHACLKALFLSFLALSACTPAQRSNETYRNGQGEVTILETDNESCTRACNNDFDRCASTNAATRQTFEDRIFNKMFGAKGDCRADLRRCLARCQRVLSINGPDAE